MCTTCTKMIPLFASITRALERFQHWFDDRFGWFFTNGMKEHRAPR